MEKNKENTVQNVLLCAVVLLLLLPKITLVLLLPKITLVLPGPPSSYRR